MGCIHFSIDTQLAEIFARRLGIRHFIETGTFGGGTVDAILPIFEVIDTVELSDKLYLRAAERFVHASHVTCHHGPSPDVLRRLVARKSGESVLFWLDAHWCGAGDVAGVESPCPLLAELEALGELHPQSVVWIDDFRYFVSPPPFPLSTSGWPSLDEVVRSLIRLGGESHVLASGNDTMMLIPREIGALVQAYFHHYGADALEIAIKAKSWDGRFPGVLTLEQVQAIEGSGAGDIGAILARKLNPNLRHRLGSLYDYALQSGLRALMRKVPRVRKLKWLAEHCAATRENSPHGFGEFFSWMTLGKCHQYRPRPVIWEKFPEPSVSKSDLPTVTIVTPSFNQGLFIERTVRSVLEQATPGTQYVIQDGGSTDSTLSLVEPYRGLLSRFVSGPDGGQAAAIREGFEASDGEIMAYLNADDLLAPGALAYVLGFFRDNPLVDVVYGHRIVIDGDDNEVGRWVLPEHSPVDLRLADFVPQETLFWRRSLYQRVTGIDSGLRFAMDWDLLLQFARAGAFMVRLPRFLAAFRVHSSQKTQSLKDVGVSEVELLRLRYGLPELSAEDRSRAVESILNRARFEAARHPDCQRIAREIAIGDRAL